MKKETEKNLILLTQVKKSRLSKTTKKSQTRNDAGDFGFPTHLQRDYQLKIVRMQKALEKRLVQAHRLALSDAHFKRLADRAVVDVLQAFDHADIAKTTVAQFYSWASVAWRSSRPVPTVLEQKVAALKQMGVMRAALNKHVSAYEGARVSQDPDATFKRVIKQGLNRAAFYARDQAGILYHEGAVKQATHDGYIGYVWVRTTSASPRDIHIKRVGQFFEFGEVTDEPGVLPNCKCSMRPVKVRPYDRRAE
jgi:hypothetical protein